jgi:outer membrane protein assembly factor BamB
VHTDEVRWDDPLGGPGPRATPTIADSRVYSLGGTGVLNVLDLQSGELVWSRNVVEENGAKAPTYGVSSSPLIVGDAVVIAAGGPDGRSLVAYHRETGEELWSGGDDPAAYSSPVLARLAGRSTILLLSDDNVVGHDAADGTVLLSYPWLPTEKVSQILLLPGERLFVSSGYGVGAKLLGLRASDSEGLEVELVWESRAMKAKFTNVVHRDGYLYGLDDGILACVDASNGERMWKGGRYGHGQVILVHDLLLVLAEDGRVALVEADPGAHRELGSFAALKGKTWNHPALAGGLLVVRNDREAACYELPLDPVVGSQPGPP